MNTPAQLDLFDKPFHSVTVLRTPANGARSHVVRYDTVEQMQDAVARELDANGRNIAYIQHCVRNDENRVKLVMISYPDGTNVACVQL